MYSPLHLSIFHLVIQLMMEMEFILKTEKMQPTSRERWVMKIPAILEQAKVEAVHKPHISDIVQEYQDDNGKNL